MSKKKLKNEIKKLKAQVLEARTSAVASSITKMILLSSGVLGVPKKPEPDEPAIIGTLRRMAEAAAAKGSEP